MKLGKSIYFYMLLLKAIAHNRIKNEHGYANSWRPLWAKFRGNSYENFVRWVVAKFLIPNFRLRVSVKLGRPSPVVYRKFYNEMHGDESIFENLAIKARQQPSYLIIRDGAMGDVIMLTPVVSALYEKYAGNISIDIATEAQVVFKNSPNVRAVLHPKSLRRGIYTYDVVIDLNQVYERSPNTHPVNAYGNLVLGPVDFDKKLVLHPSQDDIGFISEVMTEIASPYLVVHDFSHEWPNRKIDFEIWRSLLEGFALQNHYKIIYIGGDRDRAHIYSGNFEDHRGCYSIQQLSLLIASSEGFLGGDSGPSHVASATDAPMCIFYTCAHHEVRMPLRKKGRYLPIVPNIDCYGCFSSSPIPRPGYFCKRGDNACVRAFDKKDITERILQFFKG